MDRDEVITLIDSAAGRISLFLRKNCLTNGSGLLVCAEERPDSSLLHFAIPVSESALTVANTENPLSLLPNLIEANGELLLVGTQRNKLFVNHDVGPPIQEGDPVISAFGEGEKDLFPFHIVAQSAPTPSGVHLRVVLAFCLNLGRYRAWVSDLLRP